MKNIICLLLLLSICFTIGCTRDNYDEPKSFLSGQIVYEGRPLNLRGTGDAISLQLYQHGYDYFNPISVFVGQDGTFSASLFDGEYLLVTRDGNGPWVNSRDSMKIAVKGNTKIELNVTPYFVVSDDNISMSGNQLTASCSIKQIVSTAKIQHVTLLLNKTQFVDDMNYIFRKEFDNPSIGQMNQTVDLSGNSEIAKAKALFGRICVRTQGTDQGIYSPVIRLK